MPPGPNVPGDTFNLKISGLILHECQVKASALYENNMSFLDNLRKISGAGENAYWGGFGMQMGAGLHVLYKDAYFNVQFATGDADRNLEKPKTLALLVLQKIK